jgi:hypothetical protein
MAGATVTSMTQQLAHITSKRAFEIPVLQFHRTLASERGAAACRFYQVEGRRVSTGAFALNREGITKE